MATTAILDRNTTGWSSEITQDKQTKTYTLSTNGTYVDKNIALKITAVTATTSEGACFLSGSNCTLSSDNTSGIGIEATGTVNISTSGWAEAGSLDSQTERQYISKVTLPNSKTFKIDDGIYEWTISKDADGNVTVL